MKSIVLVLFLAATLAGCRSQPEETPGLVMDEMFTAMKKGQVEDMKKYLTRADNEMLEAAEKIMTGIDPEGMKNIKSRVIEEFKETARDIRLNVKKEVVNGDRATVEADIINNRVPEDSADHKTTHTFKLVKENNAWKIALSEPGNEMFNSMKGNRGARQPDLKDGVTRLKEMHPDSLKIMIGKVKQALDSMEARKKE